jgi:hypothetical protein
MNAAFFTDQFDKISRYWWFFFEAVEEILLQACRTSVFDDMIRE